MLRIKNLHAEVDGNEVLRGLNLEVRPGEVHAIMGPNGSGKSTLAKLIAGHPSYEVTQGDVEWEVNFEYKNLLDMEPTERAREGIFLAFQYPVEVPGVSNLTFLQTAFNAICEHQGVAEMDQEQFRSYVNKKADFLGVAPTFLDRSVNEGFSGGEKKRNEILQMSILNPRLALLDEIDSGLDIDALKVVSKGVNSLRAKDKAVVMITHYQRLLEHIEPDFVHVLSEGAIAKSGDKSLALHLEEQGYDWLKESVH